MSDVGPELALIWATIQRAVLDAAGIGVLPSEKKTLIRRARRWLFEWRLSKDDEPPVYSFPWCCQELQLCPWKTRRSIIIELRSWRTGQHGSGMSNCRIGSFLTNAPDSPTQMEVYF